MKKIALVGGGTAGHITPNLALIPTLQKNNFDIIYIGGKNGMENEMLLNTSIPFFGITSDKLRRYFDIKNFAMPFNVIRGIFDSIKILKNEKVDVIFSKGGYVAVPVIIAGAMLHIPIISHEADFTPGLANKIATPFSKIVCTNFSETAEMIKGKGYHTGLPIRESLFNGDEKKGREFLGFNDDKPIIFVTGGSLGAKFINNIVRKNLDKLLPTFNIVHQCGKGKLDLSINKKGYRQFELIKDELPDIMKASTLIISRAGANIIFEILALAIPNLLIPLPKKASRGDQILNANSFKNNGYSEVANESDLTNNENLLIDKINFLYQNKKFFINNMKNSEITNAVEKIVAVINSLFS